MSLRSLLLGVAVSAAALLPLIYGCADSSDEEPATTTSTSGEGGSGGSGGAIGGGGGGTGGAGGLGCIDPDDPVLAMDKLYFGDQDFNDQPDADAWRQLGHNIDGLTTTSDYTNHCLPAGGAPTSVLVDGDLGIDNAFGKTVMPIFNSNIPGFSTQANAVITAGDFTLMLKFDELGSGSDQSPLLVKLYTGAAMGHAPAFDGSDCWPVVPDQLTDPTDIESAMVTFADSSLSGNTWDSGSTATVTIPMNVLGATATMHIYHARLTTSLDSAHQGATLGRLGGVLDAEEFIEEVRKVIATFDEDACGDAFDSMATAIRQASDIMKDGTQDPSSTCDGISIGLGFTMTQVGLGEVAEAQDPPVDPCL